MLKIISTEAASRLRAIQNKRTSWPADKLTAALVQAGLIKRGSSCWLVTEAGRRYLGEMLDQRINPTAATIRAT